MSACKVGRLLGGTKLPATDRALLRGWLDTGRDTRGREVPATSMAKALTAEGHDVRPTTVKDHRGRRCACFTTPD